MKKQKQEIKITITHKYHTLELRDKKPLDRDEWLIRFMLDQPHDWREIQLEGLFPIREGKVILCPMIGKIKAVKVPLPMILQVHVWKLWMNGGCCRTYMAKLGIDYEVLAKKVPEGTLPDIWRLEREHKQLNQMGNLT